MCNDILWFAPPSPKSTQALYELQLWLHSETPISQLNKQTNKQTKSNIKILVTLKGESKRFDL